MNKLSLPNPSFSTKLSSINLSPEKPKIQLIKSITSKQPIHSFMYTLLIETTSEIAAVGLSKDGNLLSSVNLDFSYPSDRPLFIPITEQLALNSLDLAEVSSIAVGIGPGSYTGIRVGLAAAKALSTSLSVPLVGVESLALFLPENSSTPQLALHNARSRGFYATVGIYEENALETTEAAKIMSVAMVDLCIQNGFRIASPHPQKIIPRFDPSLSTTIFHLSHPNLRHMARVAKDQLTLNKPGENGLKAIYLGGIC